MIDFYRRHFGYSAHQFDGDRVIELNLLQPRLERLEPCVTAPDGLRLDPPCPALKDNRMAIRSSVLSRVFALIAGFATPATAMECTEDAMLVFDASGSMAAMGYNGLDLPRIVEARDALREALPDITPHRKMGLVIYGPGSADACSNIDLRFSPLPDAASAIVGAVDQVEPDGDTPLTEAVRQAATVLGDRGGDVVLVTDGRETCGGVPCLLAAELADTGLRVHVIGFRVRGAAFEWQSAANFDVRNHQIVARCLADMTGGKYIPAETPDELVKALREILSCPIVS